jgi:hypothetical protein
MTKSKAGSNGPATHKNRAAATSGDVARPALVLHLVRRLPDGSEVVIGGRYATYGRAVKALETAKAAGMQEVFLHAVYGQPGSI